MPVINEKTRERGEGGEREKRIIQSISVLVIVKRERAGERDNI